MPTSSTSAPRSHRARLLRRLRPAHVAVVILALGALGGTAWGALAKGSVGTRQVVDNSLQGRDIRNGTIGAVDIAQSAVSSAKIANNTITASDVAIGGLTGSQVADRTIGTSDLGLLSVGNAQLATDSVSGSKISSSAVGASEITANAVGSSELADNAVASANVIDGTITPTDLSAIPAARLGQAAPQVVPTGATGVTASFGVETVDSGGLFDPAAPTRVTVPTTGLYSVSANVQWTLVAGTPVSQTLQLLRTNGTTTAPFQSMTSSLAGPTDAGSLTTTVFLQAGDAITLNMAQVSTVDASASASLAVARLGTCASVCNAG